ncbi:MAG: cysteine desulfurase family protein [Planctomycetota bacterium]
MDPSPIYLDHAATTPLAPGVAAAMAPFLAEAFGNPSSRHPLGVRAARALEEARGCVARILGTAPAGIVFTAGGTEANNLAVQGLARARRRDGRHVVVGPTEHPSVRQAAAALAEEGFEVETARLGADGGLDLDGFASLLRPDTVLVAQMLVNNEFGTVYPIARLARIVRARAPRAALHVDAVQGPGKLEVSLAGLGADSLAIAAHKLHGPKGAGALALAPGARPRPLLFGGGQEHGLRSGTENVAGCVGLARALAIADERLAATRAALAGFRTILAGIVAEIPGARLLAPGGELSPAIVALVLPPPPAEVWLHHLEARGVLASAGSACHAKTHEISPAFRALGFGEAEARGMVRFSFSRTTAEAEVRAAGERLREVARELGGARR